MIERPVVWVGSSLRDVREFPPQVRRDIGYALYAAQQHETDPSAKPLKGSGGGSVLEIVTNHRGDSWRTIYTVHFPDAVYVLHAFKKKSTKGKSTTRRDIDLIHSRLAAAQQLHTIRQVEQ